MQDKSSNLKRKIEEAAIKRGASRSAIHKWRLRGIPADWKIRLLGEFSLNDFDLYHAQWSQNRRVGSAA
jgi:hypothetical protein